MHHSPKTYYTILGSFCFKKQVCLVAKKYVFHAAVLAQITDMLKFKVTDLVYFSLVYMMKSLYVSVLSQ